MRHFIQSLSFHISYYWRGKHVIPSVIFTARGVCQGPPEREPIGHTHACAQHTDLYKESARGPVGAGGFGVCKAGTRLGTQAELLSYGLEAEFLLIWETSVFALKAFN